MRDYQTKQNLGGAPDSLSSTRYGAGEINSRSEELENAVSSSGQVLGPPNGAGEINDQLAKAMSIYAAGGFFYTDSGAADAYVLTPVGSKRSPVAYFDGMIVVFIAGNNNTGASTVNVNSLGVKNIKQDGANPVADDIVAGELIQLIYNDAASEFNVFGHTKQGTTVQVVDLVDSSVATGTTIMAYDDTIPQNTEGDEYMSLSITPKKSTNKLKITIVAQCSHTGTETHINGALFQDSTANALAAQVGSRANIANANTCIDFVHNMIAGTTSATTFKFRIGGINAGTLTFNGATSIRRFGGVMSSTMTIEEIET